MKRIFVPTKSGADWQSLLAQPDRHWKPNKSAMTLAASWEATLGSFPPEIVSALSASNDPHLMGLRLLAALPEYQVYFPGGKTASQSDILALATNEVGLVVLTIEGKIDEEFGLTLAIKRIETSPGQAERLRFLHETLGLDKPLSDDVRYQLLHRAASAVLVAKDFHADTAVMVVHSFSEENRSFNDYARFCEQLGANPVIGKAVPVSLKTSPALFIAWCQGDRKFREIDLRVSTNPS